MVLRIINKGVTTAQKKVLAFYITTFHKPENWYFVAFRFTGIISRYKTSPYLNEKSLGIKHANLLNSLLSLLTRTRQPFPILIKAEGTGLLMEDRGTGLILCSLHIPLIKVALRHLIENGIIPDVAIAADPEKKGTIAAWGITETIPCIATGPFVLNRAKSVLQKNGFLVALLDSVLGREISPNILTLGNKLKAQVLFILAELTPGGYINVTFVRADANGSNDGEKAQNQILGLQRHIDAILANYRLF